MYLIGYDIGSSSIKVALVNASGNDARVVQSPEMEIVASRAGWAEQDPATWWKNLCLATRNLLHKSAVDPDHIKAVGISYQMHGMVLVDKNREVIRPAIIWCDSRAVETGRTAFDQLGKARCLSTLLNSPGNFTASKLKWVKVNEPTHYDRSYKMMLPGDYIAMRLTGEIATTASGLSEGILWDYKEDNISRMVLDHYGIDSSLLPNLLPTCSVQGHITSRAAEETGLPTGIPVSYRAGDQPTNAMALNVLSPGEIAATGGTSGVVYGIVDRPIYDPASRVNGFLHVNHSVKCPRIGILLCINGTGIQYAWLRQQLGDDKIPYSKLESMAARAPVGAAGLQILPFGNGAERMLGNRDIGAHFVNLQFNRHNKSHLYRAALEGIAFSFVYGIGILQEMGMEIRRIRAGNDNLFQSEVFASSIANIVDCQIELIETTGAIGAAKAAGVATGVYSSLEEAMQGGKTVRMYGPDSHKPSCENAYADWQKTLDDILSRF